MPDRSRAAFIRKGLRVVAGAKGFRWFKGKRRAGGIVNSVARRLIASCRIGCLPVRFGFGAAMNVA